VHSSIDIIDRHCGTVCRGATVARSQDDSLWGYGEIGGGTSMNRKS